MAGLGKAARGKRRWIGIRISKATESRKSCQTILSNQLSGIDWKMFDYKSNKSDTFAIIRVRLEDCEEAISSLNESKLIETQTISGKIRLVRERMGLKKTG
tara:strand:- start:6470 stop:6772 length:303 start_codon:yes stop_codon:yes gene_type:complete